MFKNASILIAAMAMANTATAQTPGLIAGYQARTDVNSFLVKDEIQATLESTIGDESCTALAAGNDYFNNGDGAYFKTIPTYKGSISPEYQEFIDFYGTQDFHIDWVQAAFDKTRTNYPSGRGDGIFEEAFGGAGNTKGGECVGYEECVKKVTAFTFNYIESMQKMQQAIDLVEGGCVFSDGCSDAVQAWDAAAAVMVGAREGTDGNNSASGSYGKSVYGLADKRCPQYGTCGPNGGIDKSKPATINSKILAYFAEGQQATYAGIVSQMKEAKRSISEKSSVPFLQGTLRYAWKQSTANSGGDVSDKTVGEGAAFSVGVTAKLWACSTKGYNKAFRQMQVGGNFSGKRTIDFNAVKLAFECNYRCMGVTCAEVGDFIDGNPIDSPKVRTCNDDENGSSAGLAKGCKRGTNKARRQVCRKFTGRPGIEGRDDFGYIADAASAPAPTDAPVAAPTDAPVVAPTNDSD